jgi:hypothetical protein
LVTCQVCGKETYHAVCLLQLGKRIVCSKKCAASLPKLSRKGRTIAAGYAFIYRPDHPRSRKQAHRRGYVKESIVVAEAGLGRPLSTSEIVHHLNGNPLDNRPENLLVMTPSNHAKLHSLLRKVRAITEDALPVHSPGGEKL